MASVVSRNNGRKFHEVAAEEVDVEGDLLEQLREAIRYNQTVKALICIELLFEKQNNEEAVVGTEDPPAKVAATKKTAATKKAEQKEDEKE